MTEPASSPPAPATTPRVDHLGIAVRDLASVVEVWERTLGVRASAPEEIVAQKVRVRFLAVGGAHLELLEPTSPDAAIARFLERRGEGIHHVAFEVPDVAGHLARLREQGVRLVDEVPRPGARGRWVAFAHPASFAGVLTEFVQIGPPGGPA